MLEGKKTYRVFKQIEGPRKKEIRKQSKREGLRQGGTRIDRYKNRGKVSGRE